MNRFQELTFDIDFKVPLKGNLTTFSVSSFLFPIISQNLIGTGKWWWMQQSRTWNNFCSFIIFTFVISILPKKKFHLCRSVNVNSTARLLISLSNLNSHFISSFSFFFFCDDMNLIVTFYSFLFKTNPKEGHKMCLA